MGKILIFRKRLDNGFRYTLPSDQRRRIKVEFGLEPESTTPAYIFWQEGMTEEVYYRFGSMEKKIAETLCGGSDVLEHFGGFSVQAEDPDD